MVEQKRGEPLIHMRRISGLPSDARRVLHIRSEVGKEIQQQGGWETPVDDLIIEERREDLRTESAQVIHPVVFVLPNVLLKVLSRF